MGQVFSKSETEKMLNYAATILTRAYYDFAGQSRQFEDFRQTVSRECHTVREVHDRIHNMSETPPEAWMQEIEHLLGALALTAELADNYWPLDLEEGYFVNDVHPTIQDAAKAFHKSYNQFKFALEDLVRSVDWGDFLLKNTANYEAELLSVHKEIMQSAGLV